MDDTELAAIERALDCTAPGAGKGIARDLLAALRGERVRASQLAEENKNLRESLLSVAEQMADLVKRAREMQP